MNLFGGGGGSKVKPQYTGLATQTSTTAAAVTIGMGLNRVAPNIIWQGDFQAHKVKQKTGKGGGKKTVGYTYSGSYVLALGWGPSTGCRRVWKDQSKETNYSSLGFTFRAGTIPQAPWGYLTSKHPSQALGYPGLIQMCVANYDLGQTNALGQHSFEIEWPLLDTAPGGKGDADPAQAIVALLDSEIFGVLDGQPFARELLLSGPDAATTGDAAFQTYCRAMGFGFSPLLDTQEPALQILDRWTKIFNTALVWTGYSLLFAPYGAEEITANGVTYLPDNVVEFDFGDDDFIYEEGEDPIQPRRKRPADCFNMLTLEIRNRANEYNSEPAPWQDQGLIDEFGEKPQSSFKAVEICEPSIGLVSAALMGQRAAYVRNEFEFTVGPSAMTLLPGSKGIVTDPGFGSISCMIIDIEETDEGRFRIVAEEYNGTISTAGPEIPQDITNSPIDTNVTPSSVNPPIIFEPPSTLAGASGQIWMAVSGGDGAAADPNWGGCYVWLSSDGTTYQQVGRIDTPARMGALTATLASFAGTNPDTAHSLAVDLAMSDGDLEGVTSSDASHYRTLSLIKDGAGTVEFLSYRDATLTGGNAYTLAGELYRGLYGSSAASHLSGAAFARLDENIFKYALPASYVGATIYAKFQSFNIFDGGLEDLASCTAYTYTPAGSSYGGGTGGVPAAPAAPTVSGPSGSNFLTWAANSANDNVQRYDIYRAMGTGQPFGSAALIGSSSGLSFTDTAISAGQGYTYFLKAVNAIGASAASAGSNVTSGAAASQPYGFAFGPKTPTASKILAAFDSPIAWTIPTNLTDAQGTIVDSDTATAAAPSAQTDFDVQSPPGTSIGTMRFAASSLTATFIKASSSSVPLGQITQIVAPSNLNGMAGAITGSIKGTR